MRNTLLMGLSLTAASLAYGSNEEPEHLIVTAPFEKTESETALPITVLQGEALRRNLANTLGETLENSPGLTNASFGPGVGQPVIRGQQGPRVKVLQNGTSAADASNVSADHAVSAEPILADSIEVIRGPATLLYGNGAIGGVVNIVDNRIPSSVPETTSFIAETRYDTASEQELVVGRIDGGFGRLAYHLDGLYRDWNDIDIPGKAIDESAVAAPGESIETTNGYVANSDGLTRSGTAGLSLVFDQGHVGLAYNRLENEYGIPPGAHSHEEGEDEEEEEEEIRLDVESDRYDLASEWRGNHRALQVLRFKLSYTDYQHQEIEGNGEIGTTFDNETWESRLESGHQLFDDWNGVVGLQWQHQDFSAVGEEAFIPKATSVNTGIFLLESLALDLWTWEFGLRYEHSDIDPDDNLSNQDFDSFSGSLSAMWQFNPAWHMGIALSRAERAPVTEELYSNPELASPASCVIHAATQTCEIGNPNLDQETANNIDLSLHWHYDTVDGFVTVYYNDFQDFIYLGNTGLTVEELPVLVYDQQDAQFTGVEAELNWLFLQSAMGDLSLGLFGDWTQGELDDNDDVPRLPPLRIGASLDYGRGPLGGFIRFVVADDQDNPGLNETATDGYTRWDAGLDYHIDLKQQRELTLFIKGSNLSDEDIRLSTSFLRNVAPESGRSFTLGLRLSL